MNLKEELCKNVKDYNNFYYDEALLDLKKQTIEASKKGETYIIVKLGEVPIENIKYWCKENRLNCFETKEDSVRISWN